MYGDPMSQVKSSIVSERVKVIAACELVARSITDEQGTLAATPKRDRLHAWPAAPDGSYLADASS